MATRKQDSAKKGKTKVEQDGESAPRLPHEHDQSSDSQQSQEGTAPRVGRQALQDVERGLVDTDRGPVVDRVYNEKVKP
jgi:hypothetical protein